MSRQTVFWASSEEPALPRKSRIAAIMAVMLAAVVLLAGCGSGGKGSSKITPPVPSILNINSSTNPSSPVSLPIEINGSGFQSAPGQVVFTQGSITATVTPPASAWSDSGTVAAVPAGNGTTNFTVPGSVTVTIVTSGGTSNAVTLSLVPMLTFDVNNVTWATTTALPVALSGLRAVVVPGANNTSAFVVVTGGYDGSSNKNTVYSEVLNPDGTLTGNWISIATNPLPTTLAHHGMAEADPANSLVSSTSRFVYVLGGQQNSTDAPGGVATVYRASVDPNTGAVSTWTQLPNNLPESLVGSAVSIFNGQIYVVGGLRSDSTPSPNVYTAAVNSDGSLGAWTKQANPYPMGIAFATAFGFGGKLYVIDGDTANSTDPNSQGGTGTNAVNFATATRGNVGTWLTTSSTVKSRKKQITWTAFGQVIDAEGIYEGLPGSLELERTVVQPDSTLTAWSGITNNINQIGANVYNGAALVSPLPSAANTPRFLLLGGQTFTMTPPGALSNKVYYNTAP